MGRVRRLAAGGWLRVDEELAAMIIHATARGAVLTWLSLPEDRRDPALLTTLRESMVSAVTNQRPAVQEPGPAGAARALRAALPAQTDPQRRRAAAAGGVAGPPRRRRLRHPTDRGRRRRARASSRTNAWFHPARPPITARGVSPSVTAARHRSPFVRAPGRARTLAATTLSVAAVTCDHG